MITAANNSPLYALHALLAATPASDPNWLEIHRTHFEDFIEMIVHDVTSIHLMLCTFLPSNNPPDDAVHEGWFYSLASLRDEWRRRYSVLASKSQSASENYYRFEHAASDDSYFVTDLADVGSETDVWNNCERVLVHIFMLFIDLDARLTTLSSSRGRNRREVADKQRHALDIVRKYTPVNVRAACLIRCQRWDEAVQVLDQADATLDACMLAVMNDVWGLSPRYENKDGLSVGVGGQVVKAFLSPSFPLLPACYLNWQPLDRQFCPHASIYVFVTLALCLDAAVMHRLKANFEPSAVDAEPADDGGMSDDTAHRSLALFADAENSGLSAGCSLTQQLIGWLLLHVFDDPENPKATKLSRKHVINDILAPVLRQLGVDSTSPSGFIDQFNLDYVNQIWKHCASHLDLISRQNPMHLIEAGLAYFNSVQFDKWADCIMNALVFCVPDPSTCLSASAHFLVPPSFFTQERRAVLQEVTQHLTELFSCMLDSSHGLTVPPNIDPSDMRDLYIEALDARELLDRAADADEADEARNVVEIAEKQVDPFIQCKREFNDRINSFSQFPSSGSWLKSKAAGSYEFAAPKLQYILQMLAVARAFQAHADGYKADRVLDVLTGRPEEFDTDYGFNSQRQSYRAGGSQWPSILLPVVSSIHTHDNIYHFFVQQPRDLLKGCYSPFPTGLGRLDGLGRFDNSDALEPDLSWLLPPYDEESREEDGVYRVHRLPLHPAVYLNGAFPHYNAIHSSL